MVVVVVVEVVVVVVVRYLDEALNKVSFDDSDQQVKLDQLLSYGLASELQCLRSRYFTSLALCDTVCQCIALQLCILLSLVLMSFLQHSTSYCSPRVFCEHLIR